MLKTLFIIISILFCILMTAYKLFICKQKRTPKISEFITIIACILGLYIIFAIAYAFITPGLFNKLFVLCLGLTPFVIGKFATYETENFYSWLQITIVCFGTIYFMLI